MRPFHLGRVQVIAPIRCKELGSDLDKWGDCTIHMQSERGEITKREINNEEVVFIPRIAAGKTFCSVIGGGL